MKKLFCLLLALLSALGAAGALAWNPSEGAPQWSKDVVNQDVDKSQGFVQAVHEIYGVTEGDAKINALPPQKGANELPVVRFNSRPSNVWALMQKYYYPEGYPNCDYRPIPAYVFTSMHYLVSDVGDHGHPTIGQFVAALDWEARFANATQEEFDAYIWSEDFFREQKDFWDHR